MIWQQPWAWIGLLAVAAPVIIHLLGLGRSPTRRFPTLRFFDITRLAPTRRTQLHDPWLLLLRMAIVAAAVAALAQPLYRTESRERAYASSLARVVVLDTSLSVQRAGVVVLDSARRLATNLVAQADIGLVLETADPSHTLDGAGAWLARQQQRRELVIISDFQIGAIDTLLLDRVPQTTGVRLLRVGSAALSFPIASEHRVGRRMVRAISTPADSGGSRQMRVQWTSRALVDSAAPVFVRVLAGDSERSAVRASENASFAVGARLVSLQDSIPARDSTPARVITIVTPQSPQRAAVLASARTPRAPWMLRAVATMQSDRVLQDIAREDIARKDIAPSAVDGVDGLVIAYGPAQQPVVWAIEAELDGRVAQLLIANVAAESLTMSALIAAARSATEPQLAIAELATGFLSDDDLTQLSREPAGELRSGGAEATDAGGSESDGRWLWLVALVLLGAEALVRRGLRARDAAVVTT